MIYTIGDPTSKESLAKTLWPDPKAEKHAATWAEILKTVEPYRKNTDEFKAQFLHKDSK